MHLFGSRQLAALALVSMSTLCLAESEQEGLCDEFEPMLTSDIAELGNVRIYRGPYDFEGARLVGCIRNTGNEKIDGAGLVYDQIQSRGGGGGTTSLAFASLEPAEVGRFVSSAFRDDRERLEKWGISGLELRSLQMRAGMELVEHEFSERLELEYPIRDLPDSELWQVCTGLKPDEQDGEVTLSELRVIEATNGEARVAGCLINGSDEKLADDRRNSVQIQYSGEPDEDYDGIMHWSGSGRLHLPGPMEPMSAGMFVGDFEVEDRVAQVIMRLTERVDQGGYYQHVPTGPEYSVER